MFLVLPAWSLVGGSIPTATNSCELPAWNGADSALTTGVPTDTHFRKHLLRSDLQRFKLKRRAIERCGMRV